MKNKVITLCGELGAGKSTTSKLLAKELDYERLYTGGIHRQRAEELGLSFHDYHKLAEQDSQYDAYVDEKLKEFLQKGENIVCDSYMAAWFNPDSFKVFLDIDPRIAAERMFEDQKVNPDRKTEEYGSVDSQLEKNIQRRASNIKRFHEYHGVENYLDRDYYDLIVDTTSTSPEDIVKITTQAYREWLEN